MFVGGGTNETPTSISHDKGHASDPQHSVCAKAVSSTKPAGSLSVLAKHGTPFVAQPYTPQHTHMQH